jgi:hypothetical protein
MKYEAILMEKLQVRWVCARFAPWFLAYNQRECRKMTASELLEKSRISISYARLLPEMKVGCSLTTLKVGCSLTTLKVWCSLTTLKANNSHPNGTPQRPYDKRNLGLQSQTCKTCQYSETNVMHFLFNLLSIKGLYMFRALLPHPQEVLNKRHLVYCVRVMSVGCTRIEVELVSVLR